MTQKIINFGSYPDDPTADAIRNAFAKTDSNFTELYGNLSNIASNVSSITAGQGITTSGSTGNVTVSAQFSALTVHSNTLSVTGLGGIIPPGGVANSDYTINNTTNTLIIEIDPNASPTFANTTITGNLEIAGNTVATSGNITLSAGNLVLVSGALQGNIQTSNVNTVQFSDATGIQTSDTNFTYTPGNLSLALGNINAQSFYAAYVMSAAQLSIATDATIYGALAVGGNINTTGNITAVGNLSVAESVDITGNLAVANVTADVITATELAGNGANITNLNATAIDTGTISNTVLSGNYSINIGGSALTSATVTTNAQPNITSVGTLTALNVTTTAIVGSLDTIGNITAGNVSVSSQLTAPIVNATTLQSSGTSTLGTALISNANVVGAVVANTITANISIATANLQITGNALANNATVTYALAANSVTAGNIIVANTVTAVEFSGAYVTVSGAANSQVVNTVDIVATGTITSDDITSTGTISGVNFAAGGSITSLTSAVTANITAGNINANTNINTATLAATGNISAANVNSASRVEAVVLVAPTALVTTVDATNVIAANAITAGAVQFTGLTSDPTPAAGLMYYNSVTGQLRLYNGVAAQWQNLN